MKPQPRLDRERAKELLGEVDSLIAKSQGHDLRKKIAQFLNQVPNYWWVGVYLVKGSDLKLDSWAGSAPTTHAVIPIGKGIPGWTAKSNRTEIVSDVSKDPRYLECFASTKAEIATPVQGNEKVVGVIDVYSDMPNAYSSMDREFLEAVAAKLSKTILTP